MRLKVSLALLAFLLTIPGCTQVDMSSTGLVKLDDGVYALIAGDESFEENLGSNRGFVVGSEAVLVIDSGYTPGHAEELIEMVREVTSLPVRYLVNTHYHPVNTWGNSAFGDEGAVIITHPETARYLERTFPAYMEYYKGSNPARYQQIKDIELALPDSLVDGRRHALDLGGTEVILEHFGPAHTAGDITVSVEGSGILFAGGIISNRYHPNMADPGADFDNWVKTLDELSGPDISYIVPGEGKLCKKEQILREKAYIENLAEACADSIRKGVPLRRLISTMQPEAVIPEAAEYGHGNIFSYNVNKVFITLLPELVVPDFELDLPDGFMIGGGGGGDKVGRMHWFRDMKLYEEIEVQWQPTSREAVLSQDLYSRAYNFRTSSLDRKLRITGDRKIEMGGEEVKAVYGVWNENISSVGSTGLWTLAMTIRGGKLYTINCLVRAGKDDEVARQRLQQLVKVLDSFKISDE